MNQHHPYRRHDFWDWMHRNDILVAYIAIVLTMILIVLLVDSLREAGWVW